MSQTAYTIDIPAAFEGMLADTTQHKDVLSLNNKIGLMYVGKLASKAVADDEIKHPAAASDITSLLAARGVVLHNHALESQRDALDANYPQYSAVNVLHKGRVYVKVEEAVTSADPVYVRYADGVADPLLVQKGSFRKSPDGVAQVMTLTPVVANSTNYGVDIFDSEGKLLKAVQITSDGSATATEICDALRAALGTVPGVTFSGTATLVITASVAGLGFSVDASSTLTVVATTANSQSAAKLPNAKYLTSASANGFAVLELDL